MKVYVVNRGYDYEGESTLAVFETVQKANYFALSEKRDNGDEWTIQTRNDCLRLRSEYGCSIIVREFEVE